MALLICPDCKGKVSDSASFCPRCGCPITYVFQANKAAKSNILQSAARAQTVNFEEKTSMQPAKTASAPIFYKMEQTAENWGRYEAKEEFEDWETIREQLDWEEVFWQYIWENSDEPFDIEGFDFANDGILELDGFSVYESLEDYLKHCDEHY